MILDEILAATRTRVAGLSDTDMACSRTGTRSLTRAIRSVTGRNAVIAELKFSSPVEGHLRATDPPALLRDLVNGGCTAISVLTEPAFFGGSNDIFRYVSTASPVPVLRKDFIIDERQLAETCAIGADAVLLIAAVLGDRLPRFVDMALQKGLEPLVEVHSREDVDLALSTPADLIGINNRDLRTMTDPDRTVTCRLAPLLRGRVVISMSGIRTPGDIRYLKDSCDAFLIGTAIMRSDDPRATLEGFVCA